MFRFLPLVGSQGPRRSASLLGPRLRALVCSVGASTALVVVIGGAHAEPALVGPVAEATPDAGVATAATAADAAVAGASVPAVATTAPPHDGLYRIADAVAVDRAVAASIEDAIRGLHPSMRDPFRAQLLASLRAPRVLRITNGAESLVLALDGTTYTATLGAPPRSQAGAEGRPVQVAHRVDASGFVQEVHNGQFRRTSHLVADGTGVRLVVELRTGLLPRPLTMTAAYAREVVAPAAQAAPAAPAAGAGPAPTAPTGRGDAGIP